METDSPVPCIPIPFQPQEIRQLQSWPSWSSTERNVFVGSAEISSTTHDENRDWCCEILSGGSLKNSSGCRSFGYASDIFSILCRHELCVAGRTGNSQETSTRTFWNDLTRRFTYPKIRLNNSLKRDLAFGMGSCYSLRYSPDGSFLVAGYENGSIDVLHNSNETLSRISQAHNEGVNNFCWIDSWRFVSCSDDACLAMWDVRKTEKPMQVVDTQIFAHNPEEAISGLHWIKDVHFVPNDAQKNGTATLYATAFSEKIYRLTLDSSFRMEPQKYLSLQNEIMRSTLLSPTPGSPVYRLLVATQSRKNTLLMIDTSLNDENSPVSNHRSPRCQKQEGSDSYRSLKADPSGQGFVAKRRVFAASRGVWSYVAYYSAGNLGNDVPLKCETRFFLREKAAGDVLQEPAFSPNGFFIANPQDRRVNILTNGNSALPFDTFGDKPAQFTQAAQLDLPNCGDILCCSVSPRDCVTVASACTLGHVHFAQPVL